MGIGGIRRLDDVLFAQHAREAAPGAARDQVEHLVAMGDSAASGLLATSGNRFHLVDSARDFAREVVTDIDDAKHHINLTFYAAHPGEADGVLSEPVIQALERRARDIPITAMFDQVGSGLLLPNRPRADFMQRLRDSGIEVIIRPASLLRNGFDDARLAVDHRKSIEIDGWIEWHGGMNLVDEWSGWYDVMQRVEGPAAAQAGAVLAARYRDLGGTVTPERLEVLRRGIERPGADTLHATRLLTDGSRHRRELSDTVIEATKAVDEQFWIMDPYLAERRTMEAIVDVARRLGPEAHLFLSPKVVGGGQVQDVFTDPFRRAWAYEFAQAGGAVHMQPGFSHAKLWRMDDVVGVLSHNKDRSSVKRSYENGMVTDDPVAVAQVQDVLRRQTMVAPQAAQDAINGWRHLAGARRALGLQY